MLNGHFTCVDGPFEWEAITQEILEKMDRVDRRATSQSHPTGLLIARELNNMKNGLFVDNRGTKRWYRDNKLHREDGPAVEWCDGATDWFKDGLRHREDGPAIEDPDGFKKWWYKGFHVGEGDAPDPTLWGRLTSHELNGGPLLNGCVVELNGAKRWYKDDQLHRADGPAFEWEDGTKCWYLYGMNLGFDTEGFWKLWDRLTEEQRSNPNLLRHMPR